MYVLFVILIVVAAALMIAIVLIQESKGGGLASNFSSSNQIMGVRKTTDFVEKATWGLAVAMVVISVLCSYVTPTATAQQSAMEKPAMENPLANPKTQQGFGVAPQQQNPTNAKQQPAAAKPANAEKTAAPAQKK